MSFLFGYYGLGLSAMSAARLGLQVAGDNIANASTPGYARRRVDLQTGFPYRVTGGLIDHGVDVDRVSRLQDRLIQAAIERELGGSSYSEERLRGLGDLEAIFGPVDGDGVISAYATFGDAFNALAVRPEDPALRQAAIASGDVLATRFRETSDRLQAQRRSENEAVDGVLREVNTLAAELADLNRAISIEEGDGTTAAPLRDRRQVVVERLVELTGGSTAPSDRGELIFSLPGGATLVTGVDALPLRTTPDAQGQLRILAGGNGADITDRLRSGKLGALLAVRDDTIPAQLASLDAAAQDLFDRANALTTSGFDLSGNPGEALFVRRPGGNIASRIRVNPALTADPSLLAVSAGGAPGDGSLALRIAALGDTPSPALGNVSPVNFLQTLAADLGNEILSEDVAASVASGVLESLEARREAVSGVSLDEEAVDLVRFQRAYEAGARFLQVLNEITEITVNLV